MLKRVCRFVSIAAAFVLLTTNVAFAASTAGVTSGNLRFASNTVLESLVKGDNVSSASSGLVDFGDSELRMDQAITALSGADYIRMDDDRGINKGWKLKVKADNLTATADDSTAGAGDTIAISIPVQSVLVVAGSNLTPINSSRLTSLTLTAEPTAITTTGVQFLAAASGHGAGSFVADAGYSLSFPNYLPTGTTVTPSDPEESSLDGIPVTDLGIFAATYSTTITYDVVAAP